ncbi:MAG: histidine phosphatase family protein [Anaerolineae bacterium]|nr:histidine phosphatase family protein [Anaerolineae bacterium]
MTFTLYLIRHGEVHNPDHILYGRLPDFHLSAEGQRQAQSAALALAQQPLSAVYASPMLRAQQTAQIIAQPHRLALLTDERLNEVYTPHQGKKLADLEPILFEVYEGNQPPYETLDAIRARLRAFIEDMRQRHVGQTIAAVTHGDLVVLAFLMAVGYLGQDIGRTKLISLGLPERYPATASLLRLHYADDHTLTWHYQRPY